MRAAAVPASSQAAKQRSGIGVVQFVKRAEMQLYTAYRHYEPDIDLSTRRGAVVGSVPLDPFQTVMTGALIDF